MDAAVATMLISSTSFEDAMHTWGRAGGGQQQVVHGCVSVEVTRPPQLVLEDLSSPFPTTVIQSVWHIASKMVNRADLEGTFRSVGAHESTMVSTICLFPVPPSPHPQPCARTATHHVRQAGHEGDVKGPGVCGAVRPHQPSTVHGKAHCRQSTGGRGGWVDQCG